MWKSLWTNTDLWLTLMDFDFIVKKSTQTVPNSYDRVEQSTPHLVSRRGALLAASLLRLPGDEYYAMHEK
jgi:hypothetical protein